MAIFARMHAPARLAALCLVLGLSLGGCKKIDDLTATLGSQTLAPAPADEAGLRQYAETLGGKYDRNPADKAVALAYAGALRKLEHYAQAAAVLQRTAASHPADLDVLGAYGKALADAGRLNEASEVLARAHTPERPNWSILSAQGSIADQTGDHAAAQTYYEAALKIMPDQPSVLSNLGLSYALANDLPKAEATLRQAADLPSADRRVRQNYALVLALRGKFAEAEAISRRDLSPEEAAENVATIKRTIAQSDTWRDLRKPPATRPAYTTISTRNSSSPAK